MSSLDRRSRPLDLASVRTDSLSSPRLADELDALGFREQVMVADIVPLQPGMRAMGWATTVAFAPVELEAPSPYERAMGFIDDLRPGEVAVMATGGSDLSAFWGGLFSAAALGRGAVAVVCDGYVRDTAEILSLSFNAFSRGTRPIDFRGRMDVVSIGAVVNCGGVAVSVGDLVFADDDGVVVVPARAAADVMTKALDRSRRESTVREELLAGASIREVWARHGTL